jgi:hypothetical protein
MAPNYPAPNAASSSSNNNNAFPGSDVSVTISTTFPASSSPNFPGIDRPNFKKVRDVNHGANVHHPHHVKIVIIVLAVVGSFIAALIVYLVVRYFVDRKRRMREESEEVEMERGSEEGTVGGSWKVGTVTKREREV